MEKETFFTLLRDLAHWEFEIFLMVLFDGIFGWLIWSKWLKKFFVHHKSDDDKIAVLEGEVKELKTNLGEDIKLVTIIGDELNSF